CCIVRRRSPPLQTGRPQLAGPSDSLQSQERKALVPCRLPLIFAVEQSCWSLDQPTLMAIPSNRGAIGGWRLIAWRRRANWTSTSSSCGSCQSRENGTPPVGNLEEKNR